MELIETIFLVLAYMVAIGFLISGLDDLFFDSNFLLYLLRNRKKPHLSLKKLNLEPEQWIAIFVPAWQEGGVVNKMAEYAARVVTYEKYDIFIGVYPNDPETIKCVDDICAQNPRIHKVVVPHPGPTNKADCLNWIYRAMRLNEIPGTREYKVIAIHDAEDVIHPLVLKLYNYFIPRHYDMGQVPVFALELPVKYWSGNTYIDDFAELHTKDLFVRQNLNGIVPSAGVGTAFARHTLEKLSAENNGDPFFVGNLTEDYEVGIRVKRAGYRAGIISYPVDRIVRRKQSDGTLGPPETTTEVVAIRESFPKTFSTAVRQRSRWILGISYQTWEQTGWAGTLPMRYTLLRDRRAPLTHLLNMFGYILLAYLLGQWLFRNSPWGNRFYIPPTFTTDSMLWKIAILDTWLLAYRGMQKFISVYAIYNFKQAVCSIPRVVLGNLINFTATVRATRIYLAHKLFKQPIVWLKTRHVFPGEEELSEYTKSVEDLLVEEGLVTREQIFQALEVEQAGSAPLCLLRMGLLDEKHFTEIWAKHSGLPERFVDPYQIPDEPLRRFPEKRSLEIQAVPVEQQEDRLVMAFREPPVADQLTALREELGRRVQPVLTRPSNLDFVRDRAYPRLVLPPSRLSAALDKFQEAADVPREFLLRALSGQQPARRSLPDTLADMGILSELEARRLWAEVLELPPCDPAGLALDQDTYFRIGPSFWWLHRMLPVNGGRIVTAVPPHPELAARFAKKAAPKAPASDESFLSVAELLTRKLGSKPTFVAELPGRLERLTRSLGLELDPDQVLLDCLTGKGLLKPESVPDLRTMRALITDSVPRWLLLQKLITEEQLHQTFMEICYLPVVSTWTADEVRRLSRALPPGLSEEAGCHCIRELEGCLVLGLSQMPSPETLRIIHHRLGGYPIQFQALTRSDAASLRELTKSGRL